MSEKQHLQQQQEEDEEAKAEVEIWKYIFGFADIAVVKCAIELGIADALEANKPQPMTLSDLTTALGCDPSHLSRIMRFLVQRRVFGQTQLPNSTTYGYTLTPISRRLVRDGPQSMASLVLFESNPAMLAPWHAMSARVRGQEDLAFEMAHGEDVWGFLAGHPLQSKLIDEGMACDARTVVPAIVKGCPGLFDGVGSVVDVGGGNGTAMATLVGLCPSIRGVNFDLVRVVEGAPKWDGVEHVGGDMFVSVPKADAAFLKWVLHDWGDEECIQILKKCKEAIRAEGGKVLIVEAVISEGVEEPGLRDIRLMLDMVMIAHTKGKERTEAEWKSIITGAGFSRYNIRPIRALQSVIEAFP
ncbi:O-methyltransferase, family 2 [Cinnamomum micranthum f. kanehirae]|uniref:O-methyltransferase, family 2 n=1 Tax=Cinnamomum micranthum f. kanehirae TaxID=337451 RepID=A0A443PNN0_9MAGN|nr:O-methyltransferase, family 2 [Cinnamomum micranthum f. kanehirae]